jgi:uncharacterized membrane protein
VSTLDLLNVICCLGSGLMAGLFFVFSVCVMRALRNLPSACGIAAICNRSTLSSSIRFSCPCSWARRACAYRP